MLVVKIYLWPRGERRYRVRLCKGARFGGPGDGDGLFRFPAGIFVDSDAGEVYVVDQLNFQVQIFDLQGIYLRCIGGTNASLVFQRYQD